MTRIHVLCGALVALFLTAQPPANAAVRVTQIATFRGAEGSLNFPGGSPECGPTTAAVTTLTLPPITLAPVSPDTQLAWTPNGNQSGSYTIAVRNPSGTTITTWTIGADTKTTFSYSAAGQPGGAWSFVESGLSSSSCSDGTFIGHAGTAGGTASWSQ